MGAEVGKAVDQVVNHRRYRGGIAHGSQARVCAAQEPLQIAQAAYVAFADTRRFGTGSPTIVEAVNRCHAHTPLPKARTAQISREPLQSNADAIASRSPT